MPKYTVVMDEQGAADISYGYRVEPLSTIQSYFDNPLHYTYERKIDAAFQHFPALAGNARYCGVWFHTAPETLIKHWQFGDGFEYDEEINLRRTANTLKLLEGSSQSDIAKFVVRFPITAERGDIIVDEPLIQMYPGSSFQWAVSEVKAVGLSIPLNCAPDRFIPDEDVQIYLEGHWIPKSPAAANAICQRVLSRKSLEPLEPKAGFHLHPVGRLEVEDDTTTADDRNTVVPETTLLLRLLNSIGFRKR